MLNGLKGMEGTFWLSELTENTLLSGLDEKGKPEPSLLMKLKDEVLIFKDFTTILSMPRDRLRAILAQLREIYDGHISEQGPDHGGHGHLGPRPRHQPLRSW